MRRKILVGAIWGVYFLVTTMFVGAETKEIKNKSLSLKMRAIFNVYFEVLNTPIKSVENFPEGLRFVPIHPADEWKVSSKNNGLIPDDKIKISFFDEFTGRAGLGLELSYSRCKLRIDGRLPIPLIFSGNPFLLSPKSDRLRERDYLLNPGSSERGEGTALTYYGVYFRRNSPIYWNAELEWEIKKWGKHGEEGNLTLLGGYNEQPYELVLQRGWDRYDQLERRDNIVLESFRWNNFYLGLSLGGDENDPDVKIFLILGLSQAKQKEINYKEILKAYRQIPVFLQCGLTYHPAIKIF